jgi:hypothetical protein
MFLLSFIYMVEVLIHIVIEFLLDLLSYLSYFFDNGVLHVTPPSNLHLTCANDCRFVAALTPRAIIPPAGNHAMAKDGGQQGDSMHLRLEAAPSTFVMLNEVKHLGTAGKVSTGSNPHAHPHPDPSLRSEPALSAAKG